MSARRPRIGRPDRIAALVAELEAEDALGFPGQPAVTRLLRAAMPVEPPALTARETRRAIREHAQQLAAALAPLPAALGEIITRITRHWAVEAVRDRTFALWVATARLAKATERRP